MVPCDTVLDHSFITIDDIFSKWIVWQRANRNLFYNPFDSNIDPIHTHTQILSFVQFVGIGSFKLNQHKYGLQFPMMERWFHSQAGPLRFDQGSCFFDCKKIMRLKEWSSLICNRQKRIKVTRIRRIFYERLFTLNYYYILNVCCMHKSVLLYMYMLRKTIFIIIYSFFEHVLMPFHFTVQVSLLLE